LIERPTLTGHYECVFVTESKSRGVEATVNEPVLSFTPDEQRVLALYRDPRNAGLGRAARLSFQYALAAGFFVAAAIVTDNALWSLAVFGEFVAWMGIRLLTAKKISGVMPRIIQKYEDYIVQLQARRDDNPTSS
jgi:hypothetical protein